MELLCGHQSITFYPTLSTRRLLRAIIIAHRNENLEDYISHYEIDYAELTPDKKASLHVLDFAKRSGARFAFWRQTIAPTDLLKIGNTLSRKSIRIKKEPVLRGQS